MANKLTNRGFSTNIVRGADFENNEPQEIEAINNALKVIVDASNKVIWTSDTDFNAGTLSDTQIVGIGDDAKVSLVYSGIDPYAWWHMNESSGTNVSDSSTHGRDGTTINMDDSDWVSGKLNNCLQFDGVNKNVDCGNIAAFDDADMSIESWIYGDSNLSSMLIVGKTTNWWFRQDNVINGMKFFFWDAGGTRYNRYWNNTYVYGEWIHYVITWNYSTKIAKLFKNGIEQTLSTSTTTSASRSLTNSVLIGGSSGAYFDGRIDEVVIYDFELTQANVTFRWNSGNGTETMFGGTGYALTGSWESNEYDSNILSLEWGKTVFNNLIPVDTTMTVKCRAGNTSGSLGAYGSALTNNEETNVTGQFFQFKVEFTSVAGVDTSELNDVSILFYAPSITVISGG